MKVVTLLPILSSALASVPGTLSVDVHKARSKAKLSRGNSLIREIYAQSEDAETVPESLLNGFYAYYATLYVGSDKQKVVPSIDTGSSDLWLMESSNPYCHNGYEDCTGQTFNPDSSTSFKNLSKPWDIQYLDTTGAFGTLSQDNVEIDGVTVNDAYFALASVANSTAVFGVGFTGNEASVEHYYNGSTSGYKYPNFPQSLKQQGIIEQLAYSLYLNGIHADDGQILFGGIDHAKYSGTLGTVPIINVNAPYINESISFNIMLSGINVRSGEHSCPFLDFNVPVLLDSGTSYALLPPAIVDNIAKSINYTYDTDSQFYVGSCDTSKFDYESLELDFSGIKLQVPPATLLDNLTDVNNNDVYKDGERQCILAVQGTNYIQNFILGDVFLRNFYVVYDLENSQIALAQAIVDETDASDVEVITAGIPGATQAPKYSSTNYVTNVKSNTNIGSCTTTPKTSSATPSSAVASSSVSQFSAARFSAPRVSSITTGASFATESQLVPSSSVTASAVVGSKSSTSENKNASHPTLIGGKPIVATTHETKLTTISCSGSSTFAYNSKTYTVTEATTLTVEDCGCTETPRDIASSPAAAPTESSVSRITEGQGKTVTEVVQSLITTCTEPTEIATNGNTYTVTEPTVLTITDCPCTITHEGVQATKEPSTGTATTSIGKSPNVTSSNSVSHHATSAAAVLPTSALPEESVSAHPSSLSPRISPQASADSSAEVSAPLLSNTATTPKVSLTMLLTIAAGLVL